jgi:hypothetical protein
VAHGTVRWPHGCVIGWIDPDGRGDRRLKVAAVDPKLPNACSANACPVDVRIRSGLKRLLKLKRRSLFTCSWKLEVLILEGGDLETSRPCERPRARLSQQHPHVTGPARALWLTQALAGAWAMAWEPPPSARARVVRARDAMWRARPAERRGRACPSRRVRRPTSTPWTRYVVVSSYFSRNSSPIPNEILLIGRYHWSSRSRGQTPFAPAQ